ncbi:MULTISPECIES: hypothetical protein [Haloarcula]|nr:MULTISPECIES: hypothetical protein [Halomicroarcula]MDS0277835.1 hypothetical protein [Halomicroarcula sp. S1AR25-4]
MTDTFRVAVVCVQNAVAPPARRALSRLARTGTRMRPSMRVATGGDR